MGNTQERDGFTWRVTNKPGCRRNVVFSLNTGYGNLGGKKKKRNDQWLREILSTELLIRTLQSQDKLRSCSPLIKEYEVKAKQVEALQSVVSFTRKIEC